MLQPALHRTSASPTGTGSELEREGYLNPLRSDNSGNAAYSSNAAADQDVALSGILYRLRLFIRIAHSDFAKRDLLSEIWLEVDDGARPLERVVPGGDIGRFPNIDRTSPPPSVFPSTVSIEHHRGGHRPRPSAHVATSDVAVDDVLGDVVTVVNDEGRLDDDRLACRKPVASITSPPTGTRRKGGCASHER